MELLKFLEENDLRAFKENLDMDSVEEQMKMEILF